ncbi:hypothetical protein [Peribacillus sp. NPDC060253]|uniref:hypothetical protein n=1 Tax=Peribacillus sp. NPDC060253 TaxID=3347084 RepID=UPI00365322D4
MSKKIRVCHTLYAEDIAKLDKEVDDSKLLDNRSQLLTQIIDFYYENKDRVEY